RGLLLGVAYWVEVAGSRRLAGADRTQYQGGRLDQGGRGLHAGGRSVSFGRGRRSRDVRDGLSVAAILRGVEGAAAAGPCAADHQGRSRFALCGDSTQIG